QWIVKKSTRDRVGPGPNYFSDSEENVRVDEAGQLHLLVTRRNDRWYAAEVVSRGSLGYGKYIFSLTGPGERLNENMVLGLFTWSNAPDFDHREIDIEFSRWST